VSAGGPRHNQLKAQGEQQTAAVSAVMMHMLEMKDMFRPMKLKQASPHFMSWLYDVIMTML
jgi:hypothetical protein